MTTYKLPAVIGATYPSATILTVPKMLPARLNRKVTWARPNNRGKKEYLPLQGTLYGYSLTSNSPNNPRFNKPLRCL